MNAAIVSIARIGLKVNCGFPPTAISAIMVSPIAREIPSTNDATMPDRAAGTTTRVETCSLLLPSANAPARSASGTADMASSDSDATVGRIMMPITSPPDSALKTSGLVSLKNQMSCSSGVTKVTTKVPISRGCTPKLGGSNRGAQLRPLKNFQIPASAKNSRVGSTRASTIPTVVATDTTPQRNSRPTISRSPQRGRAAPRGRLASLGAVRASVTPIKVPWLAGQLGDQVLGRRRLLGRHRHELRVLGDLLVVVDVELDERLHLWPRQRLGAGVDEQRPGQGLVGALLDRVVARRHAAATAVHLDVLELARVDEQVGQAEVTKAALGAGDALDEDVVVLARLVVRAALVLLAVDLGGEEVEGAGVSPRAKELQRLVREARVDLVPVVDRAALVPDLLELLGGQALRPGVLRV